MKIPTERITAALTAAGLLVEARGSLPSHVSSIEDDSRRVGQGSLFIAVRGSEQDGHEYLDRAREAGASMAVIDNAKRVTSLPSLVVRDARKAAALVASVAYDWPVRRLRLTGVTGTNGKTTTVHVLRHLLDDARRRAASIGTIGVQLGSEGRPLVESGLTTPGPIELQRVLRLLVDAGVVHVAMEVSSHALDQHRVDGVEFEAAVFTNLSRDHLDYHRTMEAYFVAKARLLEYMAPHGTVIVNLDDPAWRALTTERRRMSMSTRVTNAEVNAQNLEFTPTGSRWTLVISGDQRSVELPLIGDFNVSNALGAAAAAFALGMSLDTIAERLATVPQVPGRLEVINENPTVLRDYAHTPDALERALAAVRPFTRGRLIVVFGAGGDRDRGKRPQMGEIAARLADCAIVTSDNPRTENPEAILDDIEKGMRPGGGGGSRERIEDRREAIARALAIAESNDVVLLAGKGHETYQVRGTEKLPFDEKLIVAELMRVRA